MSKGSGGTRTQSANSQRVNGGNSGTSVTASAVRKQLVSMYGEPTNDRERESIEQLSKGSAEKKINFATVRASNDRHAISVVAPYLTGSNNNIVLNASTSEQTIKVLSDAGVKSFVMENLHGGVVETANKYGYTLDNFVTKPITITTGGGYTRNEVVQGYTMSKKKK